MNERSRFKPEQKKEPTKVKVSIAGNPGKEMLVEGLVADLLLTFSPNSQNVMTTTYKQISDAWLNTRQPAPQGPGIKKKMDQASSLIKDILDLDDKPIVHKSTRHQGNRSRRIKFFEITNKDLRIQKTK